MSSQNLLENDEKFNSFCKDEFKKFDTDESGFIERNELKYVLLHFLRILDNGVTITDEIVDKILNEHDTDNDKKINLEEFKEIIHDFLVIMPI